MAGRACAGLLVALVVLGALCNPGHGQASPGCVCTERTVPKTKAGGCPPYDVLFLVDMSTSMDLNNPEGTQTRIAEVRSFLKLVADAFFLRNPGDQLGLASFSTGYTQVLGSLADNATTFGAAVDALATMPGDGFSLGTAVQAAFAFLDTQPKRTPGVVRVIVVLSDLAAAAPSAAETNLLGATLDVRASRNDLNLITVAVYESARIAALQALQGISQTLETGRSLDLFEGSVLNQVAFVEDAISLDSCSISPTETVCTPDAGFETDMPFAPFFQGTCRPCSAGDFQDEAGFATCKQCASGDFQDEAGQTGCKACAAGEFQNEAGQLVCKRCVAGSFQDERGQPSCDPCATGTFAFLPAASGCLPWTPCLPGEQETTPPTPSSDRVCGSCPAGSVQGGMGAMCVDCGLGEFQDEVGRQACKVCLDGTFQDELGETGCKDCAPGTAQDQVGQGSCPACPLNEFQDEAGQRRCKSCQECSAGFFRVGVCGGASDRGCQACLASCPAGQHLSGPCTPTSTSSPTCQSCHPTCATCAGPNALPCASCASGFTVQADGTCSQSCGAGQFLDPATALCRACDPTCLTCDGPTSADCTSCSNPATGTALPLAQHRYLFIDRCILDCSLQLGFFKRDSDGICGQCTTCPAGTRQTRACTEFTDTRCQSCTQDITYQPQASQTTCLAVTLCQPGAATAAAPTLTSDRACQACDALSFQDEAGQEACKPLAVCSGTEFESTAPTGSSNRGCSALTVCQRGEETDVAETVASDRVCKPCDPGFFQGSVGVASCTPCPTGSFQDEAGQPACKPVTVCAIGEETAVVPTLVMDRTCRDCGAGLFQDRAGVEVCRLCPAGTSQSQPGAAGCLDCPTGTFQDEAGQPGCKLCPAGQFQDELGRISCTAWAICRAGEEERSPPTRLSDRACSPCGAGRFQDQFAQPTCKACDPGEFQDELGQLGCKPCRPGTAQNQGAQRQCLACLAGTFQDGPGGQACKPCPAGEFQTELGQPACRAWAACGEGEETAVKPTATNDRSCRACPNNFFQDERNQEACKRCSLACPQGLFTSAGCAVDRDITCQTCRDCSVGFFRSGGCVGNQDRGCIACTRRADCRQNEFLVGICDSQASVGPVCTGCDVSCETCNGPAPLPCATCPQGFFKLGDGRCGAACPTGQYPDSTGVCRPCDPRCRSCRGPGSASCLSCENPATGTELAAAQHTYLAGFQCVADCHLNAMFKNAGTGACDACAVCPAGARQTLACAEFADTRCQACVQDLTYQPQAGQAVCLAVARCAAGEETLLSPTPSSNRQCKPCDTGFFQNQAGQERCKALRVCDPATEYETVAPTPTSDRACGTLTVCQAGQETLQSPTANSDRRCQPCSPGAFQDEAGLPSCKPCPAGTFQDVQGRTACKPCLAGCAAGFFESRQCSATRNLDCTQCRQCGPGTHVAGGCAAAQDRICTACLTASSCAVNEFLVGVCNPVSTVAPACQTCEASCQSCAGPKTLPCATCANGLVLGVDGRCRSACAAAQFVDGFTCRACDNTCQTCFGPGVAQCESCDNPATMTAKPATAHRYFLNNECVNDCHIVGDYFKDTAQGTCTPCTVCAPGSIVDQPCTEFADRTCSPCGAGTFQPQSNGARCFPVKTCLAGERLAALPTPSSDRVCEACPPGFFQDQPQQLACKAVTVCAPPMFVEAIAPTRFRDRTCQRQCFCTERLPVCKRVDRKDVYFLVDGSESVPRPSFALMKTLLEDTSRALLVNGSGADTVAFGEYSEAFTQVSRVYESNIDLALQDVAAVTQSFGVTFTATAVIQAVSFIDAQARQDLNVTRVLVLITDGSTSSSDLANLPQALSDLAARDIDVLAIGVGRNVGQTELLNFTSNRSDRVILETNYAALRALDLLAAINRTVDTFCTEQDVQVPCACPPSTTPPSTPTTTAPTTPTTATTPPTALPTTTAPATVPTSAATTAPAATTAGAGGSTGAPSTPVTLATSASTQCACTAITGCDLSPEQDIFFLIDGSESVGPSSFQSILTFVSDLVDRINIGSIGNSFAIAEYSTVYKAASQAFTQSPAEAKRVIQTITQSRGLTNTATAILDAVVFIETHRRARSLRALVLITDGDTAAGDQANIAAATAMLRNLDIQVVAIGLGALSSQSELDGFVGPPTTTRRTFANTPFASLPMPTFLSTVATSIDKLCEALPGVPCVCPMQCMCPTTAAPCQEINQEDIFFLVDGSESIADADFQRMLAFVQDVVRGFDLSLTAERVALAEYSTGYTQVLSSYSVDLASILGLVGQTKQSFGITNTGDALRTAVNFMVGNARPLATPVLILLTDGRTSIANRPALRTAITELRDNSIQVITIGLGDNIDANELQDIAGNIPNRSFANIPFSDLGLIKASIESVLLSVCPPVTTMAPCTCPVPEPIDTFFLVDGSESISQAEFLDMKAFLLDLVPRLNLGHGNTSVAFAEYSTAFTLATSDFATSPDFVAGMVRSLKQSLGITNTGTALLNAISFILRNGRPVAEGTERVLVLLTDGRTSAADQSALNSAILSLRNNNIKVVAVGIGSGVSPTELQTITGSQALALTANVNFNNLVNISGQVANLILAATTMSSSPTTPAVTMVTGPASALPSTAPSTAVTTATTTTTTTATTTTAPEVTTSPRQGGAPTTPPGATTTTTADPAPTDGSATTTTTTTPPATTTTTTTTSVLGEVCEAGFILGSEPAVACNCTANCERCGEAGCLACTGELLVLAGACASTCPSGQVVQAQGGVRSCVACEGSGCAEVSFTVFGTFTFRNRELSSWGLVENNLVVDGVSDHFGDISPEEVVILSFLPGSVVVATEIRSFPTQAAADAAVDDIANERVVFDPFLGPYNATASSAEAAAGPQENDDGSDRYFWGIVGGVAFAALLCLCAVGCFGYHECYKTSQQKYEVEATEMQVQDLRRELRAREETERRLKQEADVRSRQEKDARDRIASEGRARQELELKALRLEEDNRRLEESFRSDRLAYASAQSELQTRSRSELAAREAARRESEAKVHAERRLGELERRAREAELRAQIEADRNDRFIRDHTRGPASAYSPPPAAYQSSPGRGKAAASPSSPLLSAADQDRIRREVEEKLRLEYSQLSASSATEEAPLPGAASYSRPGGDRRGAQQRNRHEFELSHPLKPIS